MKPPNITIRENRLIGGTKLGAQGRRGCPVLRSYVQLSLKFYLVRNNLDNYLDASRRTIEKNQRSWRSSFVKHAFQKLRNFETIGAFAYVNGLTSNSEDVFGGVYGCCA